MKAMLRFAACIAAFLAVSIAAFAQASPPDYEEWGRVVLRAEEAIDNNRASEAAMDELRTQLEGWRTLFNDEKSKRRVSVATVEAQLDSLGPVPETGDPEDVKPNVICLRNSWPLPARRRGVQSWRKPKRRS